jgi:hypothetical protein
MASVQASGGRSVALGRQGGTSFCGIMSNWLLPVLQCSFQGTPLHLRSKDLLLSRIQSVVGVIQCGVNSRK